MSQLSSPAIVLRTIEHGDNDKIITVFSLDYGKLSFMAKGAKKSQKRFGGVLELFSALHLVWAVSRRSGLPFLQEASIIHPFEKIRSRYDHTVYASYWCELVYRWMEEGKKQPAVYELLTFSLEQLNADTVPQEILHIAFQLHFLAINGFQPNLDQCAKCHTPIDRLKHTTVLLDLTRGGIVCPTCHVPQTSRFPLSKGTVKHLRWILTNPPAKLHRIRFSNQALPESLTALEAFVLHHLGKETKSLRLLKQLTRRQGTSPTRSPRPP